MTGNAKSCQGGRAFDDPFAAQDTPNLGVKRRRQQAIFNCGIMPALWLFALDIEADRYPVDIGHTVVVLLFGLSACRGVCELRG